MGTKPERWEIDEDIRKASDLPARFYSDPDVFRTVRERVFARSWHLVGTADQVKIPGRVFPTSLLEGCLDEPLLLVRDERDQLRCLSNVCTHRGNLLCEGEGVEKVLRCRYHGRRFGLDGRFQSMPEFDGARDFPSKADDLPAVPLGRWGRFLFASLDPAVPFDALVAGLESRFGWLPIGDAVLDVGRSRDYLVQANWALYLDNYLEGFHIPYVHAALNDVLDYSSYRTELFEYASLQVGLAGGDDDTFAIPASSPDRGQKIAGYYLWLFPGTMFNFYPWGISLNVVKPLAVDRTRISYRTYVWDPERLDRGASGNLDRVEREDEAVVESVQKGVRSRLYSRGRYSPTRETGVHHFHRLLARFLNEPPAPSR